jgi:hypothetical protein
MVRVFQKLPSRIVEIFIGATPEITFFFQKNGRGEWADVWGECKRKNRCLSRREQMEGKFIIVATSGSVIKTRKKAENKCLSGFKKIYDKV